MTEAHAIIFDFDGTLANTGEAYDVIHVDLCKKMGLYYPEKMDEHFMKHLRNMNPERTEDFWEKFINGSTEPMRQMIKEQKIETAEDMIEILRELQQRGLRMAVTTNSHSLTLKEFVKSSGIGQFIAAVSARDNVVHPKPAPDLYLHSLRSLNECPESVMVIEDSILGIRAAQAAGIQKILLSMEFVNDKDVSNETVPKIRNLRDILLHL